MNGKQLKNSILQWAIQGKLVPQDPNDEPASVLLKRIRAEKERLIKAKKIKRNKKESVIYRGEDNSYYEKFADGKVKCIDDEIPFEIPASWEWCRLGNIVDFSKSNSVKSDTISNDIWVLDLEDIEKDTGKLLIKKRKGDVEAKSDKHIFVKGNVLYSKLRPYLNKVIIADENGVCTSEILAFDFGLIFNKYAQTFLMSPFFVEYAMSDAYGVKMPRLGSKQGNNALMPIPPREEQNKICNLLQELLPIVEKYSKAQESLDKLNEELNSRLKKSILQEAIQGKLVPQDPKDEPASVLLERIRAEKEHLIKEKKIKRNKNESFIYKGDDNSYYEKFADGTENCIDEEIPFEIPESWSWVRLNYITNIIGGYAFQSSSLGDKGERVIRISDINEQGFVNKNIVRYDGKSIPEMYRIYQFDILLAMTGGTVGKSLFVRELPEDLLLLNQRVAIIRNLWINTSYLNSVINAPHIKEVINTRKNSTNDNISMADICNFLVPIPPVKEQDKIVQKIEILLAKLQ